MGGYFFNPKNFICFFFFFKFIFCVYSTNFMKTQYFLLDTQHFYWISGFGPSHFITHYVKPVGLGFLWIYSINVVVSFNYGGWDFWENNLEYNLEKQNNTKERKQKIVNWRKMEAISVVNHSNICVYPNPTNYYFRREEREHGKDFCCFKF